MAYGYRIYNTDNIETKKNAITTVYEVGDWITPNGTGAYIPASGGDPLKGICLENISTSDPRYTTAGVFYADASLFTDYFLIPVTTGSAIQSMVGSTFDLDTSQTLDVSAPGTQFEIVQVINTTTVIVKVLLTAVDAT